MSKLKDIWGRTWKLAVLYRLFLRGTVAEYGAVFLVLFLLTAIYTNWIVLDISHQLFVGGPGDATAGFLWLNTVDPGWSPILGHSDAINYPEGEQLGSPTFITYMALWLPLRVLAHIFGPIASLNIVTMWAFIGAGMATYLLLKRLTGNAMAAFFGSISVAFVPYSVSKSSAHLAYIFSLVFVLILAAFLAFWLRPTAKRAILLATATALAFYTDGYFVLLASVMVGALCVGGIVFDISQGGLKAVLAKGRLLLVSAAALLLLITPILFVQVSRGAEIKKDLASNRSNIAAELDMYRSSLLDFIVPVNNPLLADSAKYQKLQEVKNRRSNPSENANYVGMVVGLLCVVGLAFVIAYLTNRRRSSLALIDESTRRRFLLLAALTVATTVVFLSFMFSPSIEVFGKTVYLPGQFFIDHDIALWRVMSRFFIPLHVMLVVFAVYSAWLLCKTSRLINKSKKVKLLMPAVMVVLTLVTALDLDTL